MSSKPLKQILIVKKKSNSALCEKNTELNLNTCKCDINKAKKEERKLFHYSMLTISGGEIL